MRGARGKEGEGNVRMRGGRRKEGEGNVMMRGNGKGGKAKGKSSRVNEKKSKRTMTFKEGE